MIAKFFSYYKPHKRLFIIDFSSAILVAILELAFPIAVQWFIDELLPTNNWNMIVKVSISVASVLCLKFLSPLCGELLGP